MLKLHEETLPKKDANPSLHAIRAGKVQKNQKNKPHKAAKGGHDKGKGKMGHASNNAPFAPKPKTPPLPKKDKPAKDVICHQCGEVGHWRRNCHVYLAELMKKKKLSQGANTSGSKKLKLGALSLYVGDGHRAVVEAIEAYHLELLSGLVIVLNNCHYAPSITRGVISVSRLFDDGFINRFDDNNVISVSKNNLVYFMVVPWDGIFDIDMSCSNTNDISMYAITNKGAKINLDSSLLWHCRLGHISKKHIENLQHDGLLNSIDIESLGKCVSCMSGKMARKPYSHQMERAKDLLGLIHTDVCRPFKIVSRQRASYFVTFTYDFSRYGYVYLLKYKHEVFETFKVFQKEVENQLEKIIKSLRSDRGGEYTSQEFLDHLKEHRIIAHRTPPYTPQKMDPSENKVFVARNAEFFESKLLDLKATGSVEDLELIQEEDTNPSSSRTRHAPDRMCLYIDAEEHELGDLGEPANYKAAFLDPESKIWLDAMNVEMQSMKDNDVWVLVELPPNARTVGSKWLFKKKTDMDGTVYIFKARLVAKGFTQTYGVDYEETFSPVVDIRAIRILIAIVAYYDYEIWQMDVKTAFLNGHLSEEVYMEQPEVFVNPKYPNHKFGFTQNPDEPCVYLKASGSYIAILILYVDDILLMGNNIPMLQEVKSYLRRSFAMKDLGEAAYILGIKIYRDRSKRLIGLCQKAYIKKFLKRFYMENSKRETIPMQEKLKLSKSQGASTPAEKQRMQNIPYASAVGSIMYPVRCTCPDVAFAQNMTSRFQQNPGEEHWTAIKNILKYLRNTKDMFLTGYVFVLNGGAVDWKSTKQSIFATSSKDVEYIAAFDASKEAVWIRKFISGLGIVPIIEEPISGSEGCWVDFGATTHVCYERKLKFTSAKTVILKDVMHTPEMRKNLVSCYLLNKAGFIQTLWADLFTLTKNGMFVRKGYATDGMLI
nr:retrotransposon protein, putative, Ty1-copia subclass [Tanacetum cinerariifolium]